MSLLSRAILHSGPLVTLSIVRCRHPRGGPGREEEAPASSIDLPLSGVFVRHVGGVRVVGSPGNVLFYNRGEVQRVSHPAGTGDRCLSLAIEDGESTVPFARTHLPVDPSWAAELHRLRRRLETGAAETLEAEETSLELVRRLAVPLSGACGPWRGRPGMRRRGRARPRVLEPRPLHGRLRPGLRRLPVRVPGVRAAGGPRRTAQERESVGAARAPSWGHVDPRRTLRLRRARRTLQRGRSPLHRGGRATYVFGQSGARLPDNEP